MLLEIEKETKPFFVKLNKQQQRAGGMETAKNNKKLEVDTKQLL